MSEFIVGAAFAMAVWMFLQSVLAFIFAGQTMEVKGSTSVAYAIVAVAWLIVAFIGGMIL